jgi:hypothetical protein
MMDRRRLALLLVLAVGRCAAGSASEAEAFACGKIPATNVFDVQWSGDQTRTDQACSYFREPFDPRTKTRLQVDLQNDYFELVAKENGDYALQQFDKNGSLKFDLWGGEVKLANADVVFYIIDGWFGTIITRSRKYNFGDTATFRKLSRNPPLSCITHNITSEAESFACGKIPATNVFDVQWSGDQAQTDQACSYFREPFDPRTKTRLQVDLQNDYFELVAKENGDYALQQFDKNGSLKFDLWGGEVKLANADVAFYIIDGWFGTIITRSRKYNYGGTATFTGLSRNPALSCVVHDSPMSEGLTHSTASEAETFACGQIPATNVFDMQWSGDHTQTDQACSDFREPYDPRTGGRLQVDLQNDYFKLVANESGDYTTLQHFSKNGTLKLELWGGEVKLANADVVFFIIDEWYGTIITRSRKYSYGDTATFRKLSRNPALSCTAVTRGPLGRDGPTPIIVTETSRSVQILASATAHALALVTLIVTVCRSSF